MVGIYSVFGAFMLGAAMPRGILAREIQDKLTPLATTLLLPLFFVYSGLNTHLTLLDSPMLILGTLGICVIASVGKGVACWAAARVSGHTQREALAIGSLMNARGLMELIILNIGLERGLITPLLFTMMVIMAVVTTFAAGPLFELFYRRESDVVPAGAAAHR
jgi:Kef-type K+ transport system membrane component KefB